MTTSAINDLVECLPSAEDARRFARAMMAQSEGWRPDLPELADALLDVADRALDRARRFECAVFQSQAMP